MNSAIGAMIITSEGIASPVTERKIRSDWPFSVSRSNSRRAWVSQITAVSTLTAATKVSVAVRRM